MKTLNLMVTFRSALTELPLLLALAVATPLANAADNPALFFNGYLDEIRIAKGRAVWTTDFIPPTAPYPN